MEPLIEDRHIVPVLESPKHSTCICLGSCVASGTRSIHLVDIFVHAKLFHVASTLRIELLHCQPTLRIRGPFELSTPQVITRDRSTTYLVWYGNTSCRTLVCRPAQGPRRPDTEKLRSLGSLPRCCAWSNIAHLLATEALVGETRWWHLCGACHS